MAGANVSGGGGGSPGSARGHDLFHWRQTRTEDGAATRLAWGGSKMVLHSLEHSAVRYEPRRVRLFLRSFC